MLFTKTDMVCLILGIVFVAALIALVIITERAKKRKTKQVRESYACASVSLLFLMITDAIIANTNNATPWTIVASLLGIDVSLPFEARILNWVGTGAIIVLCFVFVTRTHAKWSGEISRRQYRINTQEMGDSGLLLDFAVSVASVFKKNYELNKHQKFSETDYQENTITNELPWNIEFARIYSCMSNQAKIDPVQDWHPQNHCFISSYAETHKIAIYCAITMPPDDEVDRFLAYIHRFSQEYLYVLVAVKDNPGGLKRYKADRGGVKIEYMFKNDALDLLVDFNEYYRAIQVLYERPLFRSNMRIADVYVEPMCTVGKSKEKKPLHEYVTKWLEEPGNKQLALLGDFGQGKTIFATYLTHKLIANHAERIPILIPLRNKSPRNSTPSEILSYFSAQYGINPEALGILNANGRLLLIFDGFDEMDLVGNDDIRKMHFRSLWKLVTPKSKVLITGRPNYFLNPSELRSALGLNSETKELPYCQDLYLQPFDQKQIALALRNASESVQQGIQRIISGKASASFLDLISRPSQLFLVSQIWDARGLAQKYRNLTSATIINEFLQSCFERQSAKGECDPYFFLAPSELEYFMTGIAVKMYKTDITAISRELFYNTISELIDMFPERLSTDNSTVLNLRSGKSVKAFAHEDRNNFEAIVNDVRICGVLINDYINEGFAFAHKSFFDLLVAKYFLGKSLKTHDAAMVISSALSASSAFNVRLKNDLVIRKLLAELISTKITVNLEGASNRTKCRKIFDQCYKVIIRRRRGSPQKLLKLCLNGNVPSRLATAPVQTRKEIGRLLLIFMLLPVCIIIFIVQGLILTDKYAVTAIENFANIEARYEPAAPPLLSMDSRMVIIGFLAGILFLCVLYWSTRVSKYKADLVLLTWYYACRDSQIPEQTILYHVPPQHTEAFTEYIKGRNLTDIHEKLIEKRTKKHSRQTK